MVELYKPVGPSVEDESTGNSLWDITQMKRL